VLETIWRACFWRSERLLSGRAMSASTSALDSSIASINSLTNCCALSMLSNGVSRLKLKRYPPGPFPCLAQGGRPTGLPPCGFLIGIYLLYENWSIEIFIESFMKQSVAEWSNKEGSISLQDLFKFFGRVNCPFLQKKFPCQT